MPRNSFEGRVAVVTGAGSGMGYEEATYLARAGAKVVINDVRTEHGSRPEEATAEEVAAELNFEGLEVIAVTGSISDENFAVGLVERAVEQFGRIDILINNAGIVARGTCQDTETKYLMDVLAVNFLGCFWTQRTALKYMREQDYGRIVNTSSGAATFGAPNVFPYIVSKSAVLGLSRSGSLDNQDRNIRINSFCPVARTMMDPDYFDNRSQIDIDSVHPKWAAAVALYLAGENCELHGETLSAGAGVWARTFVGKTSGTTPMGTAPEDVASALSAIMDPATFAILRSAQAQYDD